MLAVGWVLTWEWEVNLHVASPKHGLSFSLWPQKSWTSLLVSQGSYRGVVVSMVGSCMFAHPALEVQQCHFCCILLVTGNSQGHLDSKGRDIDLHFTMGGVSRLDSKKSTWDETYGCHYLRKYSLSWAWSWGLEECGCSESSECRVVVEGLQPSEHCQACLKRTTRLQKGTCPHEFSQGVDLD